ncbi:MAG: DUF928 domain-containing protein [Nostoc sp.]|uniref:DUF928 domain-containing protein n=1 Tax=Nostoc sp. TaxID=1180 RepID=UPI002FF92DDF
MILTKLLSWISIIIYTVTFFLSSFAIWVPPAQADCIFIVFCSSNKSSFRSKGGVKRGPCATEEFESLIALAPERKLKLDPVSTEKVGETVEGYPTFWFYLPPYRSSIKSAKFVLLDENRHLILQDPVYAQLPQFSQESQRSQNLGIIAGLTLPRKENALQVGKQYSWYFSILCDYQKPSRNPEVTGQIQRVLPGPLPRVPEPAYIVHNDTYTGTDGIKNVVFYDTVTQLVKKRRIYSSDWNTLLSKLDISSSVETVELKILDEAPKSCDSLAVLPSN